MREIKCIVLEFIFINGVKPQIRRGYGEQLLTDRLLGILILKSPDTTNKSRCFHTSIH